MRRRSGLTLVEAMMGMVLFSMLSLVLIQAVREASKVWRRSSGASTAQLALRQAQRKLAGDFASTSFAQVSLGAGTIQLASGGRNGDVIWGLSAIDPATGNFMRKANGSPFFQANVLYYLAVPSQHSQIYGVSCPGFKDAAGLDQGCPHKMLIRKVIDFGPATLASDESTEETLMTAAQVANYLTQPTTLNVSFMQSEAGVRSVGLVTPGMLSLGVSKATTTGAQSIDFDASSVSLLEARKNLKLGSVDLSDADSTYHLKFTVSAGLP